MIRRFASVAVLFAATFAATSAHAEGARPPIGHWVGVFQDGSTVELYVEGSGNCLYGIPGGTPTVGTCSWKTSSPAGGILTIKYWNAGFESFAYYGVIWIDATTLTLSDPYFRVTMKRS